MATKRDGFALTTFLFVFLIIMSITMIGVFDVAGPQIKKTKENTQKIIAGMNEVKEAVIYLWNRKVTYSGNFPAGTITLQNFKKDFLTREFVFLWWKEVDKAELVFTSVPGGVNVEVKLTLKAQVRFDERRVISSLKNAAVKNKTVTMLIPLRTEKVVL